MEIQKSFVVKNVIKIPIIFLSFFFFFPKVIHDAKNIAFLGLGRYVYESVCTILCPELPNTGKKNSLPLKTISK